MSTSTKQRDVSKSADFVALGKVLEALSRLTTERAGLVLEAAGVLLNVKLSVEPNT